MVGEDEETAAAAVDGAAMLRGSAALQDTQAARQIEQRRSTNTLSLSLFLFIYPCMWSWSTVQTQAWIVIAMSLYVCVRSCNSPYTKGSRTFSPHSVLCLSAVPFALSTLPGIQSIGQ